jgi:hypothetical protein
VCDIETIFGCLGYHVSGYSKRSIGIAGAVRFSIGALMAEFSILHFAKPGERLLPVGILLLDTTSGELLIQCRNDWDKFSSGDDLEVLRALSDGLIQLSKELGAVRLLNVLEETFSNSIRITDRQSIASTDIDATLKTLYSTYVLEST